MNVRYTTGALRDMHHAREYTLSFFGEQQAAVLIAELKRTAEQIVRFPLSGEEGRKDGTREVCVRHLPFILVYRVRGECIEVLACIHHAQRWP